MASNDTRKVGLQIEVSALNTDELTQLSKDLNRLAQDGNKLAPELQKVAAELNDLAGQAAAIKGVEQLTGKLDELRQKQEGLQASNADLRQQFDAANATYQEAAQAQRRLQDELNRAVRAVNEAKIAQQEYSSGTTQGAKRTEAYRQEVRRLAGELAAAKRAVLDKRDALNQSKQATDAASTALAQVTREYEKSQKAVDRTAQAIEKTNAALNETAAPLQAAGISTRDLAKANDQLINSYNEVTGRANSLIEQRQKEAEAAKQAAEQAKRLAEERIAAAKREQQEFDRLAQIEIATRERLERAAQEQLAAELRAQAEATQLTKRLADERARVTTTAANQTSQALEEAFGSVGVRSTQEIRAEIDQVRAAMERIKNTAGLTGAEIERAFAAGNERIERLQQELDGAGREASKTGETIAFLRNSMVQLAAAAGGLELGQAFIRANVQLDQLRRVFEFTTGSAEGAADAIEFLRGAAQQTGQSVGALSDTYSKFMTSASLSKVPLDQARAAFQALAQASGQLGLTSARSQLVFEALTQIVNKGKVSLEELQGQLGESLPGALALTADGLGITTGELVKLVESGELLAEDFLPAFTKALQDNFGNSQKEVQGLVAEWNRFKNVLTDTAQTLGDSAVGKGLLGAFFLVRQAVDALSIGAVTLSNSLQAVGKQIAALAAFATGAIPSFQALKDEMALIRDEFVNSTADFIRRTRETEDAYKNLKDAGKGAAENNKEVGDSYQATAERLAELSQAMSENSDAARLNAIAAIQNADGYIKTRVAIAEYLPASEEATRVAKDLADAKAAEVEAMVRAISASGDERAAREAEAQAAEATAAAFQRVADARRTELEIAKAAQQALAEEAARSGEVTDAKRSQIEALNEVIAAKQAEFEKSQQQAEALRSEAFERQLAAQVLRDNSAAVNEYAAAVTQAQANLSLLIQQEQAGLATRAQVIEGTKALSEAQALYRDSLNDVAQAAQNNITAIQTKNTLDQADIRLQQARIATMLEIARQEGRDFEVRQLLIQQKELEIRASRLKATAIEAEARASAAAAQADLQALQASNQLTQAKRLEIEARIAAARAKEAEAGVMREELKLLERELDFLNRGIRLQGQDSSSREKNAQSIERQTDKLKELNNERERENELVEERRREGVDEDGFTTDKSGNRLVMGNELGTATGIANFLRSAGVRNEDEVRRIVREFTDPMGNVPYMQNPGQQQYGGSTLSSALLKAAEQVTLFGDPRRNMPANQQAPAQGGGSRTVNVNIGGRSQAINVASDGDANNLVNLLRQFESASRRA